MTIQWTKRAEFDAASFLVEDTDFAQAIPQSPRERPCPAALLTSAPRLHETQATGANTRAILAHLTDVAFLKKRPAGAEGWEVTGHWEADLSIELNRSAIAAPSKATTRFAMPIHLPRQKNYGLIEPTTNVPAYACYGVITMKNAFVRTFRALPVDLRRSLTRGCGKEMSAHALLSQEIGLPVYFADAKAHGIARAMNTSTVYFGKAPREGTDISRWRTPEIQAVTHITQTRPHDIV